MYRQLQRLIQGRTSVQTATEIDTREDKCTLYRQLQSLIQERTIVQTATEIDTGEDNCAGSCRELILERTSVLSYRD